MELLMREAGGLRMVHVPYRSGAEAVGAIIKGEADVSFVSVSSALSFVRAGTVRALAVGAARPVEALPETPTIAATVPGFTANIWHGVLGPAGVPTDLAARANAVFNAIAALPEVQETLRRVQAAEVVGGPPERFGELIRAEIERWTPVVRAAGIRAD
jgi:tripartite-type tricarboxylate transporter receptor subunit TctC